MKPQDTPKILIVDDRQENLFAMEKTLKKLDVQIFKANSGQEALALTLRHEFALVLLDVQMPEMDGFEVATLMRDNDQTKHIPIIFVTAISKEERYVFQGYESGAVDYLFKPVDPDILKNKAKVFLDLYSQKHDLELMQAELQRSNKELKSFAHVVSHDLKSPLALIKMAAENIRDFSEDNTDEAIKISLDKMFSTIARMQKLIVDLLQYAQVEENEVEFEEVDLNKVMESVSADLEAVVKDKKGAIEISDLLTITANPTLIRQLLQNLVNNSLKFHKPDTPPVVKVSSKLMQDRRAGAAHGQDLCQIIIQDNGIGFNPQDAEKMFGAFSRLKTETKYEGSGLGLSTCRRIVDRHGGDITAKGEVGQGAEFIITLPIDHIES